MEQNQRYILEGEHLKWYHYELLDEKVDNLDILLRNYHLEVGAVNDNWVAALLPYASNQTLLPKIRRQKLSYLVFKTLPGNMKQKFLFNHVYKKNNKPHIDEGFIFKEKSLHVQNCIKNLVENIYQGNREGSYANVPKCDSISGDTMGMYLLHGILQGERDNGRIVLHARHPVLSPFHSEADKFRSAYDSLLFSMKMNIQEKDLRAVNGFK